MLHPIMIGIVTANTSMTIYFWNFLLSQVFCKKIKDVPNSEENTAAYYTMELPGALTQSTVRWGEVGTSPRTYKSRQLLQALDKNDDYFVDYVPSSRDAIHMPPHVLYVIVGVIVVVVACYAILGHLINDMYHDLADWVLGPNPNEEEGEFDHTRVEKEERWKTAVEAKKWITINVED